ncbi:hypothetical protein [Paenibacillus sp. GP183]|uniref:hypothetical protein n=1 Tax=Paenibacillus sp. GP183 TaxID=1882751 RepID=UPI00089B323B|nr:hypothetical protein [Paenibacillus sp. GP183]SEB77262.1 hypothetical protein SAMN05443246_1860 [Paenibacillus sp. GP183]
MTSVRQQTSNIMAMAKILFTHKPFLNPMQVWNPEMDNQIQALEESFGINENEFMRAIQSGLYLWNENLESSHVISQEITSPTGSYWHGLIHRMEGDFSNAKYWFNDARHHPISTQLVSSLRAYLTMEQLAKLDNETLRSKLEVLVASPVWNPAVFVDAVALQLMHVQDSLAEEWLRQIQYLEMKLLLNYCYEQSYGGSLLEAIEQQ